MPSAIDLFVSYKFIKQLATPWEEWEAYQLGLIDNKGRKLRKANSGPEKRAYPRWKIFVRNIKRIFDKLPLGKTKLGSFAGALFLLKEEMKIEDVSVLEEQLVDFINNNRLLVESDTTPKDKTLRKGYYTILESGKVILVKKDVDMVEEILGYPVFVVDDFISEEQFVLTELDIKKLGDMRNVDH